MTQAVMDFAMGAQRVAGVDEVGRGPLAGDVITAAVILDPRRPIKGLADSKRLSPATRSQLAEQIKAQALCYAIGRASVAEIDQLNILQATLLAMSRAVAGLTLVPDFCQIDGNRLPPDLPCPAAAIVGGDARIAEISAASILAKVQRDAEMLLLHQRHPRYGFDQHKGYATAQHLAALRQYGPLEEHRRSFAPLKSLYSTH